MADMFLWGDAARKQATAGIVMPMADTLALFSPLKKRQRMDVIVKKEAAQYTKKTLNDNSKQLFTPTHNTDLHGGDLSSCESQLSKNIVLSKHAADGVKNVMYSHSKCALGCNEHVKSEGRCFENSINGRRSFEDEGQHQSHSNAVASMEQDQTSLKFNAPQLEWKSFQHVNTLSSSDDCMEESDLHDGNCEVHVSSHLNGKSQRSAEDNIFAQKESIRSFQSRYNENFVAKKWCFTPEGMIQCRRGKCQKEAKKNGMCAKHIGVKMCSYPDCNNQVQSKGKCFSHGGGVQCSVDGCVKKAQVNGKCVRHGGVKNCLHPGCAKAVKRRGKCFEHGSS